MSIHLKELLHELHVRRSRYQRHASFMLLGILVIFGVPAFAAYRLGVFLDGKNDSGQWWLRIALAVSFIFSWIVFIVLFRRLHREMNHVESEIKRVSREMRTAVAPVTISKD